MVVEMSWGSTDHSGTNICLVLRVCLCKLLKRRGTGAGVGGSALPASETLSEIVNIKPPINAQNI